ncbi:MAG TPA: CdaR family protein [Clostridiales bacterium]|nr:CdaR family protein [Clostridiales bacterium]HOL91080.1 CdaR family protein [Clostridiales bacterium]HPP35235.1 CdaR family protein [Clostridiales bacterium]
MRIADWFKKDIKIKVLAFFIALLFWLYVSNVTNPFKTVTIYNVPVNEINKDYLDENDYKLKNQPRTFIDITVRGRQNVVEKIRSTDFEVYMDYSQIKSVSYKKLTLSEPVCMFKNVTIESYNPKEVDIQLTRYKTKYFDLEVVSNVTMKPGYVMLRATASTEQIPVIQEETVVDSIASVKAFIELADVDRDTVVQQVQCKAFDKNGNEIPNIDLMKVNVTIETAKEVPVSLVTRGRLAANHIEILDNRVVEPSRVLVKGPPETLENLKEIKTEQVDIDGLDKDLSTTVPLVVPEGTELVNSPKDARVFMDIEGLVVRNFEFTKDDIAILNARNDGTLVYEIVTDKVLVQFRGLQTDLNSIVASSLRPAVDVADLAEGTHRLQLNLNLPQTGNLNLVQRAYVEVRISRTPETPPEENQAGEQQSEEKPPANP